MRAPAKNRAFKQCNLLNTRDASAWKCMIIKQRIHQMNQINQISQVNQINQISENSKNQVNQISQISENSQKIAMG